MPIYDYICESGHRVEVVHGVHADGPTTCGVCGQPLRKAVSAPAIVFKGSGWAKVDARKATGKASSSTDGGSTEKDESSAKEKATDKPAESATKAGGTDSSSTSSADAKSSASD